MKNINVEQFKNPDRSYNGVPLSEFSNYDEFCSKMENCEYAGTNIIFGGMGDEYYAREDVNSTVKNKLKYCRENNLTMWYYDECGYPSGRAGGHVLRENPKFEAVGLYYTYCDYILSEQTEISLEIPEGTPFYCAYFSIDLNGNITDSGVEVTDKASDKELKITLPNGKFRVLAFVENIIYEGSHAQRTGKNGYINVLDPQAVKCFIKHAYDSFYKHFGYEFGKVIKAAFNDEVSTMNGYLSDTVMPYPVIAWYSELPKLFLDKFGYDIKQSLPSLFNNIGDKTTRYRIDYYTLVAEQQADAFFGQLGRWCKEHNIAQTGHLVWEESLIYHAYFYGNIFPSLKQYDWPGIDVLGCEYGAIGGSHTESGPCTPKLISSIAHLYKKERTISESFCLSERDADIEDMISHVSWQWVLGINTLSQLEVPKYRSDEDMKKLNIHTGRLTYMMLQGEYTNNVAVYYPISAILDNFIPANRHVHYLLDNPKALEIDINWSESSRAILDANFDFDYIDDEIILNSEIKDGKIFFNDCTFETLVISSALVLKIEVLKKILSYAENGINIIIYKMYPQKPEDERDAAEFSVMLNKFYNHKNIYFAFNEYTLKSILKDTTTSHFSKTKDDSIYFQHRILDNGDLFFIVNNEKYDVTDNYTFKATGKVTILDPYTTEITEVNAKTDIDKSSLELTIKARQCMFVVFER